MKLLTLDAHHFCWRSLAVALLLCAATFVVGAPSALAAEPYDVILRGGRIVDGTGAPWYVADVGIRDGRIVAIGRLQGATRTVDATGLVVAPGFIDMMGQSASALLDNPRAAENLLSQGITTINCGEGVSASPPTEEMARQVNYRTMAEYFQMLDMRGLPVNATQTIGHTQARLVVLGDVDRRPSDKELDQMRGIVREAMDAGAIGLSTSLIYPPAVFADTREIAALAQVAGESGGRYYTHMRNEGDRLLEAIDEALEIGRLGRTPVHIFHLKAAGQANWPKMAQAIERIRAARAAGQQVAADIYPYINNGLGIAAFIHPRHFAEGDAKFRQRLDDAELRAEIRKEMETRTDYENWYRHVGQDWNKVMIGTVADDRYAKISGRSLAAIAKELNEDPWETFFQLVRGGAFALPESMSEENVTRAIQQEFVSFCTDVGPASGSRIASHPRAYGAFPRLLARYVRDQHAISLERAVAQASAVAANEVLAYDRGRIAIGLAADLALFDYEKLADEATFADPRRTARGVKYVLVNGQVVWEDGKLTGKRPGRVLRGPGYRPRVDQLATEPSKARSKVTVDSIPTLDHFFTTFVDRHRVPGCTVAMARDGQLLYARGFGWLDVAERAPATPETLFRIASISKPVTAIAVMKLVEAGKLNLDDRVFDLLQYEPHLEPGTTLDERQNEITIRHLLHHRGGWDRDKSFDAMFQSVRFAEALGTPPPAGPTEVIRCMLGQKLDFNPGERYAYSNYGYCLLGRIIELKSGQDYETFVREQVLEPSGARDMRLGKTRLEERHAREARYYDPAMGPSVFAVNRGQQVPHPYGAWNLEAMDAHGGWLASAVDLVRLTAALEPSSQKRLLKPESLTAMVEPPTKQPEKDEQGRPKPIYYGLGWFVRRDTPNQKPNSWHTGSLPGTSTILIRRYDGLHIAVLFNSRVSPEVEHLTRALEAPLHDAIDQVPHWPAGKSLE